MLLDWETEEFGQTMSSVANFILAMIQFPEVQRKAQMEIDAIVGSDRLPSFADRVSLPYGQWWHHE